MKRSGKSAVPAAPADLKPAAQKRWTAIYPVLARRGAVDLENLRAYCQVWARWREAEDLIQKAGQLTQTPGGRVVPSPMLGVSAQAAKEVRSLAEQLGIGAAEEETPPPTSSPAPADGLLTRRMLAGELGTHMMTITKWEQAGMPVAEVGRRGRPSRYRLAQVLEWLKSRDDAAAKTGTVDVARERARKEKAQAILAEQTVATRAKDLLLAADVEKAWNAEVRAVRTAILNSYTSQADRVHRAAVLDGVAGVERALKALAHELLRELASRTDEDDDAPTPAPAPPRARAIA